MNPLKTVKKINTMMTENGIENSRKISVFFDVLYCRKKFHATYSEYFLYDFQNLKNCVRKNYLLTYHQRGRYPLVDGDTERKLGLGKDKQYELFSDMIGREWLKVTPENIGDLEDFIKKHGKVILKPVHGSKARGIFSILAKNIEAELPEKTTEILNEEYLCEEYLKQHADMEKLNPNSVNTIRIMTLCDGENVKVISAAIRTATDSKVCDNLSSGGLGAAVDIDTGIIFSTGSDVKHNRYFYHPVTNTQIIGFKIPFWEETKEFVKKGALRVSKTAIVGWDIAISPNGPCLIEANNRPAGRPAQVSSQKPCGEEIINYINTNWHKYHKKIPKSIKKLMKKYG